jgi:anthrone oxygenase-like protein
MIAFLHLFRTINLVFGAVLFGSMVMEFMMIIPVIRALPAAVGLQVLQLFTPVALRFVPRCGQVSMAAALAALASWKHMSLPSSILTVCGVLFTAGGILVTYGWYLPSDGRLRSWPLDSVPPEYSRVMERWSAQHTLRSVLYCTGFILFVTAAVWWP